MLAASPYQNAANPYDVNVDGVVNGADVWPITEALKAGGERALIDPNGPVHLYVDPSGNNYLSPLDEQLLLLHLIDPLDEAIDALLAQSASEGNQGSGDDSSGVAQLATSHLLTPAAAR